MSYFDIALIVIISFFGLYGLWGGLVRRISAIIGLVVASFVSTHYYGFLADQLQTKLGWGENISNLLALIIFLTVVGSIVSFLINQIFKFFKEIPFVGLVDRILGFLFGIFGGMLFVGLIIYFIDKFPFSETIIAHISSSVVAPWVLKVSSILLPLIPEALKVIESATQLVI